MFRNFAENRSDMRSMDAERKQEIVLTVIVWGIIFAVVPIVMLFRDLSGKAAFDLSTLAGIWLEVLPFFVLFVIHNMLVAPLLVKKKKGLAYAGLALALLLVFGLFVWFTRRPPEPFDGAPRFEQPSGARRPPQPFDGENMGEPSAHRPPMSPEVMKFMMGFLVIGAGLGLKFYLKSLEDERRMQELKIENLDRQLEGLRYQINPHFFMNTLNNIHALVDIDPEKAKESIEEFSKLMRHVLYDGDRPTIPLSKEVEFLRHYVSLMRMRCTDAVRIDLTLPEHTEGVEIPPLVLASFVENAFKHGISYEKPSFISISVDVSDGWTTFKCSNSRHDEEQTRSHGIGLQNLNQRLDLLYGDRYTLDINRTEEVYDILLQLPVSVSLELEEGV